MQAAPGGLRSLPCVSYTPDPSVVSPGPPAGNDTRDPPVCETIDGAGRKMKKCSQCHHKIFPQDSSEISSNVEDFLRTIRPMSGSVACLAASSSGLLSSTATA